MLNSTMDCEMEYVRDQMLESGVMVSRIWVQLPNAYFFDKAQWPAIIDFYEEKFVALDAFWEMAGDVIKALAR